ncbi:hypothetical protein [Nisaea sp.]|uniref:hypothetical protein n=1 Tax=Nisaea sp. TaxID=2024842 RepID=UPI0032EFD2AB
MKRILSAFVLSAALIPVAVAPVPAQMFQLYDGVAAVRGQADSQDGFAHSLAAEYRRFALSEADDMADWIDAEHFAKKTLASARGEAVPPEDLADWTLGDAQLPALQSSRARLISAFDRDARILAPHASARAQAQFDCWVEQAEEGHQKDDIAACRDGFLNAMLEIDASLDAWDNERIEQEYPAK